MAAQKAPVAANQDSCGKCFQPLDESHISAFGKKWHKGLKKINHCTKKKTILFSIVIHFSFSFSFSFVWLIACFLCVNCSFKVNYSTNTSWTNTNTQPNKQKQRFLHLRNSTKRMDHLSVQIVSKHKLLQV